MKLTILAAVATACALVGTPALAQSPPAPQAKPVPQATGAVPPQATISAADFVKNVVMRGMFDVQAARLAEQKGDQNDKSFAGREISNHTKMTNDLKSIIASKEVNAAIPTALTNEYQQRIDRLQKLSGKQFDQAYANEALRSHENLNALFNQYGNNGGNTELKQWAAKTAPEVKQQLSEAARLT